jgi:hypothetical protein
MFTKNQEVVFLTKFGLGKAKVLDQRHYTDDYTHWDIEITESVESEGKTFYPKGNILYGIPEKSLAKVA